MPESLEREWHHDGARCVCWHDYTGRLHAAAIRQGIATMSIQLPCGAAVDDIASALNAAIDATSPRRRRVDTNVVTDVLLVMSHQEIAERELQRPFQLSDDLLLLPAHPTLEQAIVHACDARGRDSYFSVDLRGPGQYVIARHLQQGTSSFGWDRDQRIQTAVALGRLVRPTPVNLRYAVRITGAFQSGAYSMYPAEVRGHAAHSAVMQPADAWLREADFTAWRDLLLAWDAAPFDATTPRWSRAMWHLEYTMTMPYFHLRWPLVALAFEGLITTNVFDSGGQFRVRFAQVRAMLGLASVSEQDAKKIWGHRSDVVHGGQMPDAATEAGRLYGLLEETLRESIRRAIVDPQFRAHFASPATINATFPVPKRLPRAVTCPSCGAAFAS